MNLKIRKCFYSLCIISILMILNSCKDNPVYTEGPPKNPTEYTWTVDTLEMPGDEFQMAMESIWGTSPKNMYACGHTASGLNIFWHYDGIKWSVLKKPQNIMDALDLFVVAGTSPNNIWLAGGKMNPYEPSHRATSSPFIANIDAQGNWKEFKLPFYQNEWIGNLYIESENDIWALGYGTETALFHFDGTTWKADSLNIYTNSLMNNGILLRSMVRYNNELYMSGEKLEDGGVIRTFCLFKRISGKWQIIDSSQTGPGNWERKFEARIIVTADNKFITYGEAGLYEWDGTKWFHKTTQGVERVIRSSFNNLLGTWGGKLFVINGSDFQPVEAMTNSYASYYALWSDGREAFVAGATRSGWPMKSYIWHGK